MNEGFIVPLNGLAQGRTGFRWCVGEEFFNHFENSDIIDADLEVDVQVRKSDGKITVDCEIEGAVTVICDRCLEDLTLPVETDFGLRVKFGEPDEEDTEGGREIVCLDGAGTAFDLSQAIYDYVCLSLPVQRVHEEGGCNPETLKYLNSEDDEEMQMNLETETPFAVLKDLLKNKKYLKY